MYYLRQPDTTGGNRTCTQVLLPYRIHAYVHIFNVHVCVCTRLVLYVQDWYYVYWARMVLNWARLVVNWATGAMVAKRCVLESNNNTSLCLRISQQRVERGGSVHMHQSMTHHTVGEDVCGGRHRQLLDHLQTQDTR